MVLFVFKMNNLNSENVTNTKDTILNAPGDDRNNYSDMANEVNVTNVTMESSSGKEKKTEQKSRDALIVPQKPLCADYRSDSGSDSMDSESDSTLSDTDELSSGTEHESSDDDIETSKDMAKQKTRDTKIDFSLVDLPPIENLTISVPENECVEIGIVTSVVDTLVVVESYKGTAALDVDTVLFLDHGKRPLGKIFDVLGPISEPVYTVRFNDQSEIEVNKIEKGLKVYFAPKTEHTSFVFLSEIMKMLK